MLPPRTTSSAPVAEGARGPRLMVLLLGIVLLPTVFVGWIASEEYREVVRTRQLADEARTQAMSIRLHDELRLALVEEQSWNTVLVGADELNVPLAFADRLMGRDVTATHERAIASTDALLAAGPLAAFENDVAAIRSIDHSQLDATNRAYDALVERIGAIASDRRVTLEDRAGDVPQGADVVRVSRLASAATTARFEHVRQLWSFLQAEFSSLLEASPSYVDLVEHRAAMRDALDHIERKVDPASPMGPPFAAIGRSEELADFNATIDRAVDDLFDPTTPQRADERDAAVQAFDLVEFFDDGVAGYEVYDALVRSTDAEAAIAGSGVVAAAEDDFRTTVLVIVALGLVSLVAAIALARYIGRPIVRLAAEAERLGTGAAIETIDHGPKEVRQVGLILADASTSLVHMERLEHEATHDELTGVPTRRLVREHLEQALARARRTDQLGVVMFVDVDHFKDINDTYGHAAGDEVLRVVADRIREPVRDVDLVGRYGGDEFIVVAESAGDADDVDRLADRIVAGVAAPVDLSRVSHHPAAGAVLVSVSVGVAMFRSSSTSIDEVLSRADRATYAAKAAGRNRALMARPGPERPLASSGT